ncbi:MAG TPA: Rne/Rng family ribonuclease [Candidatus Polarisedimenticolaceae bacterium]|nr:Rne/Rng family ribonuclease [Candidatus Polarisedimenticolaceae bacterium]
MPNELLVSRLAGRVATALRENGEVVELRVEDGGDEPGVGDVFKGRVTRVLPGIQAAFVDIGAGPDAFLHAADLHLPGEMLPETGSDEDDAAGADDPDLARRSPRRLEGRPPLQDRLREGREVVVQVVRETLGGKGPRVTSFATLPGRYLVYAPLAPFRGVSKRVEDGPERDRLREMVRALAPAGAGFIVRTAGRGTPEAAFHEDAARLAAAWRRIEERAAGMGAPAPLHREAGLFLRALRDAPRLALETVVVEDQDLFDDALRYLDGLDTSLASRVRVHTGPGSLFDDEGIHAEIERSLRSRVWLPSGGTVVIEPTEALVSIDVDTGKNVGTARPEETILETNLEAADEIARQLRLRDLGGIVVVDFIDMERAEHRNRVVDAFTTALQRDAARTKVIGLSPLGLLQLTRKRTRPGLRSSLTEPCACCSGSGRSKSSDLVAHEALLEVRRLLAGLAPSRVSLRAHPEVARVVRRTLQSPRSGIDAQGLEKIEVEEDAGLSADRFDVRAG